jgi:hypothetical protein
MHLLDGFNTSPELNIGNTKTENAAVYQSIDVLTSSNVSEESRQHIDEQEYYIT